MHLLLFFGINVIYLLYPTLLGLDIELQFSIYVIRHWHILESNCYFVEGFVAYNDNKTVDGEQAQTLYKVNYNRIFGSENVNKVRLSLNSVSSVYIYCIISVV